MSVTPSVKYVKVGGSMIAKPVNARVDSIWKPIQNVTGMLYITPDNGSYAIGSTLTIVIRENSLTTGVNALQAIISFSSTLLQFQSSDPTGTNFDTPPTVPASNTSTTATIVLGKIAGSVTGDQLVSTVTFNVLAAGTAIITFDPSSGIARASDNTNICNQLLSATFTTHP